MIKNGLHIAKVPMVMNILQFVLLLLILFEVSDYSNEVNSGSCCFFTNCNS